MIDWDFEKLVFFETRKRHSFVEMVEKAEQKLDL